LPATRCQSSGPLGALLSSPALDVRLITALQVLQVHEVLQFVPDQLSRYGAWLWYAFARPQSEWANARAHTALCAALSSSERDRRSCATTIVVVPATHTVNKDTGLSGRGLQAHRSRSQGAKTSDSGAIFARSFTARASLGWLACLL
jgi:hypothetical protein